MTLLIYLNPCNFYIITPSPFIPLPLRGEGGRN